MRNREGAWRVARWAAPVASIACIAVALSGCGAVATGPQATGPQPGDQATSTAPLLGRSSCPGSVSHVGSNLVGAAADRMEQLQGDNEDVPGFMGVVHDGSDGIVVVDRRFLSEWTQRGAAKGFRVAPSCVDPRLVEAVQEVVAAMPQASGSLVSSGYDAVADSVYVMGVERDALLAALKARSVDLEAAARAALGEGTLRLAP
jgi:hypothetical protein